jgi:hypothetical protein
MKLFVKLSLFVLVAGLLLPFTFLKGQDGKTLMSFSDIKFPELSFAHLFGDNLPGIDDLKGLTNISESTSGSNQIYKWTDSDGSLQFSSSPPVEGIEYTVKGYDPNQNVIQAVNIKPEVEAVEAVVVGSAGEQKTSGVSKVGNPYSVEKVEKLYKDAEGLESLLNDRLKKQEAIIGQ